jgi:hypothetical protein
MDNPTPEAAFRDYSLEERAYLEQRRHNRAMEQHAGFVRTALEDLARLAQHIMEPPDDTEADMIEEAKKHTKAALESLVLVLNSPHESAEARVAAAKEILRRGYGEAASS